MPRFVKFLFFDRESFCPSGDVQAFVCLFLPLFKKDWLFLVRRLTGIILYAMAHDLFAAFPPATKEDWLLQVAKDSKGKVQGSDLGYTLWDSIRLQPLYTEEDRQGSVKQHRFHPVSEFAGMPPRRWSNLVTMIPGDTNQDLLQALENGADGLVLPLYGMENLSELLAGVLPQYLAIYILPLGNPIPALQSFLDWVDSCGIEPASLSGGMLWSPADPVFDQQLDLGLGVELLEELLELCAPYPAFKSFCIKTSRYTESGAHPLDALVYGLGELVEVLDKTSLSPSAVFSGLFLETSIAEQHFGEIARHLAFRTLVQDLAKLYAVELTEQELTLFCQTSQWSKSILDAHTNLIRQTYEAMSAILGGANVLWVRPFEEENASALERRVARNVSNVLKDEAYLDKVQDPAAGAYYLEALVAALRTELKQELQRLESEGGWWKACQAGVLQHRVKAYRAKIQGNLLDGTITKVGANSYQAPPSLTYNKALVPFEETSQQLKPTRAAYLVERQTIDSL
jgi:methylmalonyl-CoA mutase